MTLTIEGQRTFTIDEYHRMAEAQVFHPTERVELVRGVIREMSPKGKGHTIAVALAIRLFANRLADRATVQVQDPLVLGELHSEPEPDVVIFSSPDPRDLRTERSHPLLVIEVADSSLRFDRGTKASLYAEAGIAEYWIVNLVDEVIEIYRNPEGSTYLSSRVAKPTDSVTPLAFPDLEIPVRDLLP